MTDARKNLTDALRSPTASNHFYLLRRLSTVSLMAMIATAATLIFMYRQDQLAEHEKIAVEENRRTLTLLMRSMGEQIDAFVTHSEGLDIKALRADTTLDLLFSSELHKIDENDVLKLKIYNQAGMTLYSSDKSEVGDSGNHSDFLARALRGETVNHVEHRDTLSGIAGEWHDVYVAMTYMPLTHAANQTGVIEIYDDSTAYFEVLRTNSIRIALIVLGAFGYLYAMLFLSLSRTDRAIANWQDMVEEKEAELRESQIIASLGSYVLDIRTGMWKSTEMFDQLFGIDKEYVRSTKGWEALIHPEDRAMLNDCLVNDVIGDGKTCNREFRVIRHDNQDVRWMRGFAKLKLDTQGAPLKVLGTFMDITQNKKEESELRIAAIAFESQEGMMVTDANVNIIKVNTALTQLTGYTDEELIGKNPRIFSSGRQAAKFYESMWESINRTGGWEGEIWDRKKSGELYPKWLIITAVKDNSGRITHYVGTQSDITDRKIAEEKIKNLAFFDPLTGLPNRRLLLDRLSQALASSARTGRKGAMLFIDLDNFKTLNDSLGHDMGDLLLQQVAQRLGALIRQGDTVARLGGDEFVVMLEELSNNSMEAAAQTESIGEKILVTLNQPYQLGSYEFHSTPSIGITLFNKHGFGIDDLFKQADIAMYQAKKSGRNTLRFFDQKMQDTINTRASLERELRKALEKQQFQLYYQIQIDSSNRPLGAETLIRWIHPERGLISPAQFIPLAEEMGQILPIGKWVLETACAQLKIWQQEEQTRDLVLAVNVSAKQFRQIDFVAQVQTIVEQHAINPRLLKLELTESMLLENIEDTISTMNALNEIGVQFSLDDFGTGYSSLQYLKRLPLDQLKIDQSFVRDITKNGSDRAIVGTIIAMAHNLNLNVIAEGVETEEQRQHLLNMGCTHFQGFLFSRPVPIDQFESLLRIPSPAYAEKSPMTASSAR